MEPPQFPLDTFVEEVRPMLNIPAKILGKEDTNTLDKAILGMFSLMMNQYIFFDIPSFWEKMINSQSSNFPLARCFRFPSLVTYLFLYTHVERFMHLGMNIMDPNKNKQFVVFWTDVVRDIDNGQRLMYFSSSFLSIVYSILNSSPSPYLLSKAQSILQLSKDVKVGAWFQFEYYSEIRLYGAKVAPFRFPFFVPMDFLH